MNGRASGIVRVKAGAGRRSRAALALLGAAGLGAALFAAPVRFHSLEGDSAFLGGDFDGTRLDDDGALTLAARHDRVATIAEPFAFALVARGDGWAVGTGSGGKVLAVARGGEIRELFDAPEPEVFALWADADGTLFAGTSPDGKVYRIRGDVAEPFFDPGETYIWAIARGAEGDLWVATGVEGKLFRVGADGKGSVVYDATEPHLRSLLPLPSGELLIGTVGQGRVLSRDPAGVMRTLYDSPLAEVVALSRSAGGGGEIYAAVLASEASFVELDAKPAGAAATGSGAGADPDSEVGEAVSAGTRAAGASGPRSELVRISPDGVTQTLWTSQEETLFAIAPQGRRLWLGTGGEGRLHSLLDDKVRFEADFAERQIVALAPGADGPALLTTNAAALYRTAAAPRATGSFTSAVADAGLPARYGRLRWSGSRPKGGTVKVAFRFGASATADETWSEWSAAIDATEGPGASGSETSGGEVAVPSAMPARYLQYRIDLGGEAPPRVDRVELSYRQVNQRPRIERFGAMDPGQILVPANFNPADQVYEPAHPNRDGIFTPLDPVPPDQRTKTLWKRGMRTLRWRASDPNGDTLVAALAFRPEPVAGAKPEAKSRGASDGWLEIAGERKEDSYAFDATALPDGRYRFRLRVSDVESNDPATALVAEELSDVVIVDHGAPGRRAIERRGGGARLTVADDWNPLVSAEISIDAGEWRELAPVDGLVDGRSEQFDLAALPKGKLVLLRVTDAAWNVATFDLGPELEP